MSELRKKKKWKKKNKSKEGKNEGCPILLYPEATCGTL